ncbi:hypothetical protein L484_012984 [Morus notabilis]|uniref:Methyltransferase n=1 Tax=Morus notabilis TaxID=981085 RepID=W9S612_9ROSA|nr:hypothetical protein L484_012984 [Morus notabilis]
MAGLFDKQADIYADARPSYPTEWYSKLAALTPLHTLAWDVGTGNGQAALGVLTQNQFGFYKLPISGIVKNRASLHQKIPSLENSPVAEHYEQVIGTHVSKAQIERATPCWIFSIKFR